MRIIFAGTPTFAIPTLKRLIEDGHDVVTVLTREDAPIGRKRVITASPVATFAQDHGLVTMKCNRITEAVSHEISQLGADLGVVVAYGGMIPPAALDATHQGWINLHFSRLPSWRGATPAQHDILHGSASGHMTVFSLVPELDAGDIFAQSTFTYRGDETADEALGELAMVGAGLVCDTVHEIEAGSAIAVPQQGEITHAPKLSREDGRLQVSGSARSAFNRYRAVTAEPGAWIQVGETPVKVLRARLAPELTAGEPGSIGISHSQVTLSFEDGVLVLEEVQPAGKQRMSADDWLRGLQNSGTPRVT